MNCNLKILVIEENEFMAKILECILRKEGYNVISCRDSFSAIQKQIAFIPDLVIVNSQISFRLALEIIKFSKKAFVNIPIILISSLEEQMTVQEALYLGVDDFVSIPLNPNELLLRIKRFFL
jgi:PleD family two-component response regulator